jgi:hypothetical protein
MKSPQHWFTANNSWRAGLVVDRDQGMSVRGETRPSDRNGTPQQPTSPRGGLSADHPPIGNRVGLFLGAVQSRIAQFSRMLPSWIAGEADHD